MDRVKSSIIITLMSLLLLFVLAACGAAPEPESTTAALTTSETSTATITSQTETTTQPVSVDTQLHDLGNGVSWRFLDLSLPENEERIASLRDDAAPQKYISSLSLSGGKTLFERVAEGKFSGEGNEELVLREADGTETVILRGNGEYNTDIRVPEIRCKLDGRYILYCWGGWEWTWSYGIYDTQDMKDYPLEDKGVKSSGDVAADLYWFLCATEDTIYFCDDIFSSFDGSVHITKVNWRDVVRGKASAPVALITGNPAPDGSASYLSSYSADADCLALVAANGLLFYDLRGEAQRAWMIPWPAAESGWFFEGYADGESSYYWCCESQNYALEITLQ